MWGGLITNKRWLIGGVDEEETIVYASDVGTALSLSRMKWADVDYVMNLDCSQDVDHDGTWLSVFDSTDIPFDCRVFICGQCGESQFERIVEDVEDDGE